MKYLVKIEFPYGTYYYGKSNDRFLARKLTTERIARIGYKSEKAACRNWYYNNVVSGRTKVSVVAYDL